MKKGEQRIGDYVVTLTKDVKCWFCGEIITKGKKAVRMYGKFKAYWHNPVCNGMKIEK